MHIKLIERGLGVFIILSGIGSLIQKGLIGGILLLITGILCIPGVFSKVNNLIGVSIQKQQKIITIIVLFILGSLFIPEDKKNDNTTKETITQNIIKPTYTIVDEKIDDSPLKTQIEQHISLSGSFNKENIREILLTAYKQAKERTGFQYNTNATHYHIMVYSNIESAKGKNGNWVGMLTKIKTQDEQYLFNDIIIEESQKTESIKFGLTEEIRKDIFEKIVLAERKAAEESSQQHILDQLTGSDLNKATYLSKIRQDIEDKLKKEITKKYSFTGSELTEITVEGIQKGRPMPY